MSPTSPTSHRITLDASAVLAWVLRERGFETIDKVLPIAVVPVSAMVEVLYRAVERGHRLSPAQLHTDLLALGLTVEPVTDADAVRADCQKITSRPRALANTNIERASRPRSRIRSIAAPCRAQERTGTRSMISGCAGQPSAVWQ